jgi:hypothetical protein
VTSEGVTVDTTALTRAGRILDSTAASMDKAMRDGQEKAAKPLAAYVIREGASEMPAHGGLRAELMAARAEVRATSQGVEILMSTRQGYDLPKMDEGLLQHPVFGRFISGLAAQRVPSHAWSGAFDRKAANIALPPVRDAVQDQLNSIAREASRG